jgi:hypothetical protein
MLIHSSYAYIHLQDQMYAVSNACTHNYYESASYVLAAYDRLSQTSLHLTQFMTCCMMLLLSCTQQVNNELNGTRTALISNS